MHVHFSWLYTHISPVDTCFETIQTRTTKIFWIIRISRTVSRRFTSSIRFVASFVLPRLWTWAVHLRNQRHQSSHVCGAHGMGSVEPADISNDSISKNSYFKRQCSAGAIFFDQGLLLSNTLVEIQQIKQVWLNECEHLIPRIGFECEIPKLKTPLFGGGISGVVGQSRRDVFALQVEGMPHLVQLLGSCFFS